MLGPRFEKYYPSCCALLVALSLLPQMPWMNSHRAAVLSLIAKLFTPALNVAAIAIGFLATSQSILISLKGSSGVEQMKRDGYHDIFIEYLSSATSLSFLLAIFSGILSALDFGELDNLHVYLAAIWGFLATFTLLGYYRAVSLLPYILRENVPRCAKKSTNTVPFDPNKK
jgi:hypothetical protein